MKLVGIYKPLVSVPRLFAEKKPKNHYYGINTGLKVSYLVILRSISPFLCGLAVPSHVNVSVLYLH